MQVVWPLAVYKQSARTYISILIFSNNQFDGHDQSTRERALLVAVNHYFCLSIFNTEVVYS